MMQICNSLFDPSRVEGSNLEVRRMKKDEMICLTLEQVSHADGAVAYMTHASPGGWDRFLGYLENAHGVTDFEGWTVSDFFRSIIEFILDGAVGTPYVCSEFHENTRDDTPAYKISLYDLGFKHLESLDRNVQPSWFAVQIEPKGAQYTVILTPKRSLMKLIYKNLI